MDVMNSVKDKVLILAGLATIFKVAYDIKEKEREKKEKRPSEEERK